MKKIAILILCHKNAEQINLLISQFDKNFYDIYIHFDSKMDCVEKITKQSNVFILEKRIDVKWADITMVIAVLELLKKSAKNDYMYYWLISGQDLLIKPSRDAYYFLRNNYGKNFFKVVKDDLNKFKKRNEINYPSFLIKNTFFVRVIRNIYLILTGGKRHTFKLFKRKFSTKYSFLFSSQWFTITGEAVKVIFQFLKNHPNYLHDFSKSICPDECFFSTIINESNLKNTIFDDNLLYVDFSEGKANPKILTLSDYSKIKNSNYFIARKFDINFNYDIVDKLMKNVSDYE